MKVFSTSLFVILFAAAIAGAAAEAPIFSFADYTEFFCGSALPASSFEPVVRPPHKGAVIVDISIADNAFVPPNLIINVGDTVRWTNNQVGRTHTATSDTAVWNSGNLSTGQSFSYTFTEAGAFPYHCNIHLAMTASITVQAAASLVINEIDYDQPITDGAEFIELKNVSGGMINLDPVVVELINGSACCAPYQSIDLPNVDLAPGAYYVICGNAASVPLCDLDVLPDANFIQNGAPDAIGLRLSGSLVDAVSYEGDTGPPYTEGSGTGLIDDGVTANSGLSRSPDGTDTDMNNVDLLPRCITPGAANSSSICNASPTPTGTPTSTSTPTATATATSTATPSPLSGSYNVGVGQTYTSLTMPGGIFDAINISGVAGNVTINITSDMTGEDGIIALNEFAAGFNIIIKPSGSARTITGSGTTGIIRLNGADHVTIDGSTSGGVVTGVVGGDPGLRELTVENTNAATASGVIILDTGTNGAQFNTIKNLNIRGSSPDQTGFLISIGGAAAGTQGADNDFDTIENCSLRRGIVGIWRSGGSGANRNLGGIISENDISGTGMDRIRRAAITVGNEDQIVIKENRIGGIDSSTTNDALGIGIGILSFTNNVVASANVTNAEVYRNKIDGVSQTNGRSAGGIVILGDGQIYNNMVGGVISNATGSSIVAGIYAAGNSAAQISYNSVSMTGDRGATASQAPSYALAFGTSPVLVVNNILYTTQTSGGGANANSYALGTQQVMFGGSNINVNDFWSAGANDGGFRRGSLAGGGGFDDVSLAAWQAATGRDANSIEADPLFVNNISDPHIQNASPAKNMGCAGMAGDDFDGDIRPQEGQCETGADEVFGATPTATGTPSISGVITYGNAIGSPAPPRFVKNVAVASTSGSPPVVPVITGLNGQYTLTGFGTGSYTIRPTKPGGATTAITSNDAARVAQGVSGSVPFVGQNQRFVADVSGNGGISSNDAALIARFAAGLTGTGNAGQWKFFVTGAPSPLPTPPQNYNDSRNYTSVSSVMTGEDFVGLLIGEISGNWNPATHPRGTVSGGHMSDVSEAGRAAEGSITVTVRPVVTEAGKAVTIPVSVEGVTGKEIISYEFDLRYDPAVIQPLENSVDILGTVSRGLLVVTNPNEPGLLRVVVYGPMPIEEDGVLLNLRFMAVGSAGSVSPLTFDRVMFNEGEPRVLVSDGTVGLF